MAGDGSSTGMKNLRSVTGFPSNFAGDFHLNLKKNYLEKKKEALMLSKLGMRWEINDGLNEYYCQKKNAVHHIQDTFNAIPD